MIRGAINDQWDSCIWRKTIKKWPLWWPKREFTNMRTVNFVSGASVRIRQRKIYQIFTFPPSFFHTLTLTLIWLGLGPELDKIEICSVCPTKLRELKESWHWQIDRYERDLREKDDKMKNCSKELFTVTDKQTEIATPTKSKMNYVTEWSECLAEDSVDKTNLYYSKQSMNTSCCF